MADQLIERPGEPNAATRPAASAGAPPPITSRQRPPKEALQQAILCLEVSGRRLEQETLRSADEALHLLRAATAHLHQAIERREEDRL